MINYINLQDLNFSNYSILKVIEIKIPEMSDSLNEMLRRGR